jgi:hypothetical protein
MTAPPDGNSSPTGFPGPARAIPARKDALEDALSFDEMLAIAESRRVAARRFVPVESVPRDNARRMRLEPWCGCHMCREASQWLTGTDQTTMSST